MADRIYRYVEIDRSKIDRANRRITLSFSSEFPSIQRAMDIPVHRSAGLQPGQRFIEVMDHSSENVDLSLLNNRGAFLDEHDEKDHIGVVERAELDAGERIGRATVTLDTHEKAQTRFDQMERNSRPHISAGYVHTRFIGLDKLPDGRTAYRFAWKGEEISSVATPADPTIGVARNYKELPQVDSNPQVIDVQNIIDNLSPEQRQAMKRSLILLDAAAGATATGGGGGAATMQAANGVDQATVDRTVREAIEKSEKSERSRWKEMMRSLEEYERDHGSKNDGKLAGELRKMAGEMFDGGKTVGEFQTRAMQEIIKAKPPKPILMRSFASESEADRYSLHRAIKRSAELKIEGKSPIPDGLEGEVHQEMMRRAKEDGLGFSPQGFQVPYDANLRPSTVHRADRERMTRDMQSNVFNAGGAVVPTLLMLPIIELLRNRAILAVAGMRTLSGLTGNIVIPRQEAPSTAYSVSEIQALTASQLILGQIALSPKRVGATVNYSKQLVFQSSPDIEALIRDDMLQQIALKWDALGIAGSGAAGEPLGILNTPGVNSIAFAATPTYIKIVSMETLIRAANVMDPLAYVSTSTVKGTLKTVAEALTGATTVGGAQNALWKGQGGDSGMMNGWPAYDTQQVPGNLVLCGAFNQLILGLWGGFDVVVDIFTRAINAEIAITMNTWGDFAVRHPQGFTVSSDAGNQ